MSEHTKKEIADWYDQHSKSVFSFILFMVNDYQQAEDLTQDTFVKAYVYHHSFKRQSSEKTWLFRIAHNLTVDFLRKKQPALFFKDTWILKKDNAPLPEEIIELKEDSHELYEALGKLKSTYRAVIVLRKVKGFSIRETAVILGWSKGKVKSTLHRAIPALKNQLLKEGYLDEQTI